MLAWRVRAFFYKLARIAVKSYAEFGRHGFALGDQIVKELPGGREARGGAMVEESERAYGVCGSVENKLGPLSAAGILQGNGVHAGSRDEASELFYFGVGGVGRLERGGPSVAFDVEADVAGSDGVASGKCCAADDGAHVLGDELFVAVTVLHGANGAVLIESVSDLGDGCLGVNSFGGDNAEIAAREGLGIGGGGEGGGGIGGARTSGTVFVYGRALLLPNLFCPTLSCGGFRQVSA